MRFAAVDVETANDDRASICQVGIATYQDGVLVDEWASLVDPQDYFGRRQVAIHGIDDGAVSGAPTFAQVAETITARLSSELVVHHTSFDRVAITRAFAKLDLEPPECTWLDSSRVVRRAWSEFSAKGYGLNNICAHIGYEFRHHDALEDAKAAAAVFLAACEAMGVSGQEWIAAVRPRAVAVRDGQVNPDGVLFGEVIVFTGALAMERRDAKALAAANGCAVGKGVSRATTLLVVGDQDIARLAGHDKSSKHRKAEELIANGQSIRILQESDFLELLAQAT